MSPLFISLGNGIALMIIPDTLAHVDGHAVLTYSYSIYRDIHGGIETQTKREEKLHLERKNDPNYMGTIVFEIPGRSLNYISDGPTKLSPFEIQELVDKLMDIRENPALWPEGYGSSIFLYKPQ